MQRAFDEMPDIKFSLGIGPFFHVSSVPLLSYIVTRVLTVDIPRQFLFPNAKFIYFAKSEIPQPDFEMRLIDSEGIVPPGQMEDVGIK